MTFNGIFTHEIPKSQRSRAPSKFWSRAPLYFVDRGRSICHSFEQSPMISFRRQNASPTWPWLRRLNLAREKLQSVRVLIYLPASVLHMIQKSCHLIKLSVTHFQIRIKTVYLWNLTVKIFFQHLRKCCVRHIGLIFWICPGGIKFYIFHYLDVISGSWL